MPLESWEAETETELAAILAILIADTVRRAERLDISFADAWSTQDFANRLSQDLQPILEKAAREAAAEYDGAADYDMFAETVIAAIIVSLTELADSSSFVDSVAAGRDPAVPDDGKKPKSNRDLSELVAGGLAVAAANVGVFEAMKYLGRQVKIWKTREDKRVRDSHERLQDVPLPVGSQFNVGGSLADYPRDPRLPVAQRANCRCWLEDIDGRSFRFANGKPSTFNVGCIDLHLNTREGISWTTNQQPENKTTLPE